MVSVPFGFLFYCRLLITGHGSLVTALVSTNNFADWRQVFNRLAGFNVILKTRRESRSPHGAPGFHTGAVVVHSNVNISTFPLLRVECALALLEPSVLERFECGENEGESSDPILFGRAVPVFDDNRKGAHRLRIISLQSKQIDQRMRSGCFAEFARPNKKAMR